MNAIDRYAKEQDRIFQEIEHLEHLERKAAESLVAQERFQRLLASPGPVMRLLQSKAFRGILDTATSVEERWRMIEEVLWLHEKRHSAAMGSGKSVRDGASEDGKEAA